LKNPRTWIVTALAFIWLVVVIVLDALRMSDVMDEREKMKNNVQRYLKDISSAYELGLSDVDIPSGSGEMAFFLVRILLLIIVFPMTVLSHHATILMPKRWHYLRVKHGPVRTAKIVGVLMFFGGFVAMIVGASVRAAHPWFSPDDIFSAPLNNLTHAMSTLEDQHRLCARSVADWSLLQLAAIPVLVEARSKSPAFYSQFAQRLVIPLLENDPDFTFRPTAFVAFDRAAKRLLIAPAAIPFVDNYGIYLENRLSDYYGGFIDECVPLYGIASTFFLKNLLAVPTEALTTGILGPNRLTVQWLNNATLSVKQDLEVVSEIITALGLAAEHPVFVGHGAGGLIVKALQIDNEIAPWRVAFESAALKDSPMATLADASDDGDAFPSTTNFIGAGSLFARSDELALANINILVYPKASELIPRARELVPPHAVRTFCHIQAACGADSFLDDMCERAFPGEFRDGMCETYERPRTTAQS
jgi:hypothetical protein